MRISENNPQPHLNPAGDKIPEEMHQLAAGLESEFYELLFKEMEKTVPAQEEGGAGSDYYKSLLLNERATLAAKQNRGQGLQKLILEELLRGQRGGP